MALCRRYLYRRICRFIFVGTLSYLGFYANTIQAIQAQHSSTDQNVQSRIGAGSNSNSNNNNNNSNKQGHAWKHKLTHKKSRHRPTGIYPRGGASLQEFRDVIQISQRSKNNRMGFDIDSSSLSSSFVDQNWGPSLNGNGEGYDYVFSRNNRRSKNGANTSTGTEGAETETQPKGVPVVYRYFGRSRARSVRSDSIPFIVIGPSVDHWKLVGRILASRGFNVMAIERVNKDKTDESSRGMINKNNNRKKVSSYNNALVEGEALVSTILNVLKWQRAILVGCDEESVLAIEAALRLAPDRIVGLVLCGDLTLFQKHVQDQINNMKNYATGGDDDDYDSIIDEDIDSFLNHYVECPCSIIWDGDVTTWSSSSSSGGGGGEKNNNYPDSSSSITKIIHGGGMAPHRRLPEQFAWTLTRFVEKKVSTLPPPPADNNIAATYDTAEDTPTTTATDGESRKDCSDNVWKETWKEMSISQVFAPGTLLVSGRILATAIIYISIARVSVFQYKNIRDIQLLSWFQLSKRKIVQNLFARIRNIKINNVFTATNIGPFTPNFPKMMNHLKYNSFLRRKKDMTTEKSDNNKVHLVEEEEDEGGEDRSKTDYPDSPSAQGDDSGENEKEDDAPNSNSPPNDNEEENAGSNPLLHKLLFFDHIIS